MSSSDPAETSTGPAPAKPWRRVALYGAAAYLLPLAMLVLLENFLVYPAPRYPHAWAEPEAKDFEDVSFRASDGVQLHGWRLPHPQPRGVLLYCHGNGENVSYLADFLRYLRQRYQLTVFAFDYRGYGRSEGSPHEQGVLRDAEAAQRWLADREGIKPNEILVMGRSLGGAVAVHLAATQGARALVLESTFTSMPDVAASIYWWAPVRWLMRNRYESARKIAHYRGPLLQSHGTADSLIPLANGKALFAAAASDDKRFFEIPGGDHNDLQPRDYYDALEEFLGRLDGRPQ